MTLRLNHPLLAILLTITITLLISLPISAQHNEISGIVTDNESGKPLPGVNVFLDNTFTGTTTDSLGSFRLKRIPDGVFTVVVSMVGYRQFIMQLDFPLDKPVRYDIRLKPTILNLGKIVVTGERPNEWLRDLRKFRRYFLGYTRNAEKTEILNPEVLDFEEQDGAFKATSLKPLIIRNNALGYEITYVLQEFSLKDKIIRMHGKTLYSKIDAGNESQFKKWRRERERAFYGSYHHFIQSLIDQNFYDQGFRVYATDSRGRYLVDKRYATMEKVQNSRKILQFTDHPNKMKLVNGHQLTYLRVEYINEEMEPELIRRKNLPSLNIQVSWIELPKDKAVIDIRSGREVPPYQALLHGYWGWTSRIPDILPANYSPGNDKLH